MRLNVGLPKIFWAEAVNSIVYLINRSSCSAINFKVLDEVWTRRPVDYSNLRIFGCPAYMHVPGDERTKLNAKSKKCVFLGYPKCVKGYMLWDPESKKTVISRDFVFDEADMLKKEENEQTLTKERAEESTIMVEFKKKHTSTTSQTQDKEEHQKEPYSIAAGRERRTIRAPKRYKDMVSFALFTDGETPSSFEEAVRSTDSDKWSAAMAEEMESLRKNQIWELVELPKGKVAIGSKWVYRKNEAITAIDGEKFKA